MPGKVFIDTNILIYASLEHSGDSIKKEQSKLLLSFRDYELVVSTQVINESYYVFQRNGLSDDLIQKIISEFLFSTNLALITEATIRLAWDVKNKYKFSIWDSLIAASALETECSILYSEDFQHTQLVEGKLQIINPFL